MARWPTSEEQLGPPVIAWLEARGWDVYQEVTGVGGVADIVAVQARLVWVVELKRSLGLAVIAQAQNWRAAAHFVSVAVPHARHREQHFLCAMLAWAGIGWISVRLTGAEQHVAPPLLRHPPGADRLRASLRAEHRTFAPAGNAAGARFTPYAATCRDLRAVVAAEPGLPLKDAIARLKEHHYASDRSAVSSLSHWIQTGKVDGVEARRDGRYLRLFPRRAA